MNTYYRTPHATTRNRSIILTLHLPSHDHYTTRALAELSPFCIQPNRSSDPTEPKTVHATGRDRSPPLRLHNPCLNHYTIVAIAELSPFLIQPNRSSHPREPKTVHATAGRNRSRPLRLHNPCLNHYTIVAIAELSPFFIQPNRSSHPREPKTVHATAGRNRSRPLRLYNPCLNHYTIVAIAERSYLFIPLNPFSHPRTNLKRLAPQALSDHHCTTKALAKQVLFCFTVPNPFRPSNNEPKRPCATGGDRSCPPRLNTLCLDHYTTVAKAERSYFFILLNPFSYQRTNVNRLVAKTVFHLRHLETLLYLKFTCYLVTMFYICLSADII